jgi:aldehyde:ferredoxin oxidoreductase
MTAAIVYLPTPKVLSQLAAESSSQVEATGLEMTDEQLRAMAGRLFLEGRLVTTCPWCERKTMAWKPTRTRRPFGHCNSCLAQVHVRSDIAEEKLLSDAIILLQEGHLQ